MRPSAPIVAFIERHRTLDGAVASAKGDFISDWNGSHPFVKDFLSGAGLKPVSQHFGPELSKYTYFDDTQDIADAIRHLHSKYDGLSLKRANIIAGAGSSPILAAFAFWLIQNGYEEICYVPPLYYTFHYLLRTLSIRARPVSGKHLFEAGAALNLPSRRSVLLITDPIWFAGRRLTEAQIDAIAAWQSKTGSLVFVDGSFQFTQWDGTRKEFSARFDQDLTFRVICPAKSLAIPAFRFAYLLLPAKYHSDFLFLYESMVGASNFTDLRFARRALAVLTSKLSNRPLTGFFSDTYHRLVRANLIVGDITPDSGYFAFVLPTKLLPVTVRMTQEYFELKRHPCHVRINLMVAAKFVTVTPRRGRRQ